MSTRGDVSIASLVDDVRVACDGTRGEHADLQDATHYGRHTCGYVSFLCDDCANAARAVMANTKMIAYCKSCNECYPPEHMSARYTDFTIGEL